MALAGSTDALEVRRRRRRCRAAPIGSGRRRRCARTRGTRATRSAVRSARRSRSHHASSPSPSVRPATPHGEPSPDRERPAEVVRAEQHLGRPGRAEARIGSGARADDDVVVPVDEVDERVGLDRVGDAEARVGREPVAGLEEQRRATRMVGVGEHLVHEHAPGRRQSPRRCVTRASDRSHPPPPPTTVARQCAHDCSRSDSSVDADTTRRCPRAITTQCTVTGSRVDCESARWSASSSDVASCVRHQLRYDGAPRLVHTRLRRDLVHSIDVVLGLAERLDARPRECTTLAAAVGDTAPAATRARRHREPARPRAPAARHRQRPRHGVLGEAPQPARARRRIGRRGTGDVRRRRRRPDAERGAPGGEPRRDARPACRRPRAVRAPRRTRRRATSAGPAHHGSSVGPKTASYHSTRSSAVASPSSSAANAGGGIGYDQRDRGPGGQPRRREPEQRARVLRLAALERSDDQELVDVVGARVEELERAGADTASVSDPPAQPRSSLRGRRRHRRGRCAWR